ncbi:MAG TPA: hypothetical protein VKV05_06015 [Terriglobales bacterium]|nr:hypothetical protein [Terriglobales bacterium]
MKLDPVLTFLSALTCALLLLGNAKAIGQQGAGSESSGEVWGGRGVLLKMNAQGATLEFDCARGTILQPIKPDANGEFSVSGTYSRERGGPVRKGNPGNAAPAIYKGSIQGDTMQLEIIPEDSGQALPALTLARGEAGRLVKCR